MAGQRLADLEPIGRDLAATAVAWMDDHWDDAAGLLQRAVHGPHAVRESAYYALGLLLRGGDGDGARASRALGAVLGNQYDAPGRVHHGTFARAPEEPPPPTAPVEWRDYDPNWREFIGTTLALILRDHESALPPALVARIDDALRRAVAGGLARALPAAYTNIALMHAALLCFVAARLGEPTLAARGEAFAREIHGLFRQTDAFNEYNSPTYYGVDLYALALWRTSDSSAVLRELGADMEARLWTDIARYYHAGLGNIAGPYDRSYGMDMGRYGSALGLWIWLATGREAAPFPAITPDFPHAHDFCPAPAYALLGVRVPDDARRDLLAFRGERTVERSIEPLRGRVATAWLGADAMVGAQASVAPVRGWVQFHPATIHWRGRDGAIGWVRLLWNHDRPLDARATRRTLAIRAPGPDAPNFVFHVHAPGLDPAAIERERWRLPGLDVRVETAADGPRVVPGDEWLEVRYAPRRDAGDGAAIVLRLGATAGAGD